MSSVSYHYSGPEICTDLTKADIGRLTSLLASPVCSVWLWREHLVLKVLKGWLSATVSE